MLNPKSTIKDYIVVSLVAAGMLLFAFMLRVYIIFYDISERFKKHETKNKRVKIIGKTR